MKKIFTLVALVATAASIAAAPALNLNALQNFGTEQKSEIELKKQEIASNFTPKAIAVKAVADNATIDIKVDNITDSSAVATITPTDLTARWYVTYTTTAAYKTMLDSLKSTDSIVDHYINLVAKEISEFNFFASLGLCDSAYISNYTHVAAADTTMKVLVPKTSYTVLAFYVDTLNGEYHTNYKLATAEFTTASVATSENVITLDVKDDSLHIATSNADGYLLYVAQKDSLDNLLIGGRTVNDLFEIVAPYLHGTSYWDDLYFSGDTTFAIADLMPTFYTADGTYTAIAVPCVERGYRNGDATTVDFPYTKPAPKNYNITLETAEATSYGYDEYTGLFEIQTTFYQQDTAARPTLTFDLYAAANQSLVGDFTVEEETLYTGIETSWITLKTGVEWISDGEIKIELVEKRTDSTAVYNVSGYVAIDNFTNDTCRFSGKITVVGYNRNGDKIELERKPKTYDVTITKGIGTTYGYDDYMELYQMYFSFYTGTSIKETPNFTFTLYAEAENSLIGDYSVDDKTLYSYYGTSYITFDSGDENVDAGSISIKLVEKKELTAVYEISGQVVAANGDTCNLSGTFEAACYDNDEKQIELEPTTALRRVNADASVWTADGRVYADGELKIYDLLGRDVTTLNGSLNGVYVVKTENAATKVVVRK